MGSIRLKRRVAYMLTATVLASVIIKAESLEAKDVNGAVAASLSKHPVRAQSLKGLDTKVVVAAGSSAVIKGQFAHPIYKSTVVLQRRRENIWRSVSTAATGSHGKFSLRYKPKSVRSPRLRIAYRPGIEAPLKFHNVSIRTVRFRSAQVSYYGPGMYGASTACGRRLGVGTVGVAHKTLPCGTLVTFANHGHTVTAPVIDRGPYSGAREFDLTEALKNKLHFGSTGTVRYNVHG